METPQLHQKWRVILTKDDFVRLRHNGKFQSALLLGRGANGLRFAIRAGNEVGMNNGSVAARQRIGSYFVLSASLEEFIKRVVPDVRKDLDHLKAWKDFERLVDGDVADELRKTALARIRNTVAFHLTREHIQGGLKLLADQPYSLAHGDSSSILDVHVDLADRVAGAFATQDAGADLGNLLEATSTFVQQLLFSLDQVMGEAFNDFGLEMEVSEDDA